MSVSVPVAQGIKFRDMGIVDKLVFMVKLCLFLATFGFAFPTLLSE